jgi:hypothetical protein
MQSNNTTPMQSNKTSRRQSNKAARKHGPAGKANPNPVATDK